MAEDIASALHVLCLVFLLIVILFGNSLVIIAFKTNPRLRTATYTFLVSLAVSDFLVGSVSLPLWIYHLKDYPHTDVQTEVTYFYTCFDIFSALASIFHLTAVTLERWVAICKPFYYNTLSRRSYHISILMAWLLALIVAALWPKYYIAGGMMTPFRVYTTVIFLVGLLVPAILITFVNLSIFNVVKSLVKNSHQHMEHATHQVIQRNVFKDRKTAITLALITALFCVSWTPFFLVNLIPTYCGSNCSTPMTHHIAFVSSVKWLHYSNSAYNPVVYAFRDQEMRMTFVRLFERCCGVFKVRRERARERIFTSSPICRKGGRNDAAFSTNVSNMGTNV